MSSFQANRDIKIDLRETPGGLHLLTSGMSGFGAPELEMEDVDRADLREAGGVINTLADTIVNEQRKVQIGERIAVLARAGALVARVSQGSATDVGFFGKLLGRSAHALRVGEPIEGMRPLRTLFATIRLWRAEQLLDGGDRAAAAAELRSSIVAFPGEPERSGQIRMGFAYDWENHLSYAMLADTESELAAKASWLEKALARSDEFHDAQVGDTIEELRAEGRDALLVRTRFLARENALPSPTPMPPMEGMRIVPSPLRTKVEHEGRIIAERSLTLVPAMMAEYQPRGVIAGEPWCEAVVDVLWAQLLSPAYLLALTEEVRRLYDGDKGEAPKLTGAARYEVGDRLLSLLLADARRCEYGGVSVSEYRARGHAIEDATLAASAAVRLQALVVRESEAYAAAMGM